MTWRPLYVPQTEQAWCGSFRDLHCGHSIVATTVAFHCDRRDRVLLRDILRFGTATADYSSVLIGPATSAAGRSLLSLAHRESSCSWP
jgi:hypothetical protein